MSQVQTARWQEKAARENPAESNLESYRRDLRQIRSSLSASPPLDLEVWRSYSSEVADQSSKRVALVAKDSMETKSTALDLTKMGYEVHHTTDLDAMLAVVLVEPKDWHFIMFDLDFFESVEDAVNELTDFRQICRAVPVLLLSSSVSRDELSDYRRAVGDATLRKPVYHSRLQVGIDAMKQNCEAGQLSSALRLVTS